MYKSNIYFQKEKNKGGGSTGEKKNRNNLIFESTHSKVHESKRRVRAICRKKFINFQTRIKCNYKIFLIKYFVSEIHRNIINRSIRNIFLTYLVVSFTYIWHLTGSRQPCRYVIDESMIYLCESSQRAPSNSTTAVIQYVHPPPRLPVASVRVLICREAPKQPPPHATPRHRPSVPRLPHALPR
jgi:hypothetical protein